MRFASVSIALLALAHSLAPGVHAAPAVVSDHTNSLAVRQDPGANVASLTELIIGILQSVLGTTIPPQVVGQVGQIAQKLQMSTASGVVPRGPSSSDPTSSTSFTTLSSTTTSHALAVATDQIGTSTVSSVSGVTPQASSTLRTRMRRQFPSALPTSLLSVSIVGSQSASLPVPSVAASVLSALLGKLGSTTSESAASKPTPSTGQV